MSRRFLVTIEGSDSDTGSLRPVHLSDAIARGLNIPHDRVSTTLAPEAEPTKATLYGHEIHLEEPDSDDEIITDVIVVARVVRHKTDGTLEDALWVSPTPGTTSMVQMGMTQALAQTQDPFGRKA